ncbi:hypothetical protein SDC9_142267 [bioreactor metagenome]|uniref:Uncharacterized protein n=1 Tax=bioreactor metagenome TaxID=1076179 RepID=A0A645E0N6_9ZZZZ
MLQTPKFNTLFLIPERRIIPASYRIGFFPVSKKEVDVGIISRNDSIFRQEPTVDGELLDIIVEFAMNDLPYRSGFVVADHSVDQRVHLAGDGKSHQFGIKPLFFEIAIAINTDFFKAVMNRGSVPESQKIAVIHGEFFGMNPL